MPEIKVCGRWPLSILPNKTGGHFSWYLTGGSSPNADCILELIEGLPTGMSVAEHFGGIGEASTVFQNILKPSSHWVSDIDPDCVEQLRAALPSHIVVNQGDAKEMMKRVTANYVALDFAYYTIREHDKWPWAEMFAMRPKYVQFADSAKRRIGLHRGINSRVFGEPIIDYEDYTRAYSDYMARHYGYRIVKTVSQTYSYHLLEPV